jgi:hypothetical protein
MKIKRGNCKQNGTPFFVTLTLWQRMKYKHNMDDKNYTSSYIPLSLTRDL